MGGGTEWPTKIELVGPRALLANRIEEVAQRAAVLRFAGAEGIAIVAEHIEAKSGRAAMRSSGYRRYACSWKRRARPAAR